MRRVFMVITPEGQFITGRSQPKLVLVKPKIEGSFMTLSAIGMPDIRINIDDLYKITPVTTSVWQQPVLTVDCGDAVAKWLSKFVCNEEIGLRLVFYPNTKPTRPIRPKNLKYKTLTTRDGVSSCIFAYLPNPSNALLCDLGCIA